MADPRGPRTGKQENDQFPNPTAVFPEIKNTFYFFLTLTHFYQTLDKVSKDKTNMSSSASNVFIATCKQGSTEFGGVFFRGFVPVSRTRRAKRPASLSQLSQLSSRRNSWGRRNLGDRNPRTPIKQIHRCTLFTDLHQMCRGVLTKTYRGKAAWWARSAGSSCQS